MLEKLQTIKLVFEYLFNFIVRQNPRNFRNANA